MSNPTARPEAQEYLIWCTDVAGWWTHESVGHTTDLDRASRWDRDAAMAIALNLPDRIAVPLSEALEGGPPVEAQGTIRPVEVLPGEEPTTAFHRAWDEAQTRAHQNARAKGWHDTPREDGTMIALMHSELSEALEAMRRGNPPSKKIPAFSHVEEELADVVIRIMDFAGLHGLDLGGAIEAKMAMNEGRSYRHGGKAF